MPQVNITISDEVNQLLSEMSEATGISKSSLAAEYVRKGLYEDVSHQTKVAEFRKFVPRKKNDS